MGDSLRADKAGPRTLWMRLCVAWNPVKSFIRPACRSLLHITFEAPSKNQQEESLPSAYTHTHKMTSTQDQVSPLREYILTQDQTRYIVKERYLQELLDQKFGQGIDFKISVCWILLKPRLPTASSTTTVLTRILEQTKSHRWRYWAPRELEANEVK